ncbi:hypothetical protein WQ57_07955 [Mesobacillus campisalis]|uniref:ABC transporter permease n=1 Tax=Mesobacillus campisalis TaxID=1408103 RepID=A0A0M2SVD5_9BACI|nr:TIGR02206 family membrane protein [Mesobacillus campisalis]KKK38529.1 hypothetical protein WQ57_07955 [Mesobacillus campisalis]
MNWLSGSNEKYIFEMYSASHLAVLAIFILISAVLYFSHAKLRKRQLRILELLAAGSLFLVELGFHLWLAATGNWNASDSLPLELCSISLFLTIILLITKNKLVYELLLFTALLGASQALLTPLLNFDFPHFRFFHFFFTHMMMIWAVFYFTWVLGFRPTIRSVYRVFIFLNILLPFVLLINKLVDGNYMFLSHKPGIASLLDFLGPYPWYILSLEGLVIIFSLLIWLVFKGKTQVAGRKGTGERAE